MASTSGRSRDRARGVPGLTSVRSGAPSAGTGGRRSGDDDRPVDDRVQAWQQREGRTRRRAGRPRAGRRRAGSTARADPPRGPPPPRRPRRPGRVPRGAARRRPGPRSRPPASHAPRPGRPAARGSRWPGPPRSAAHATAGAAPRLGGSGDPLELGAQRTADGAPDRSRGCRLAAPRPRAQRRAGRRRAEGRGAAGRADARRRGCRADPGARTAATATTQPHQDTEHAARRPGGRHARGDPGEPTTQDRRRLGRATDP